MDCFYTALLLTKNCICVFLIHAHEYTIKAFVLDKTQYMNIGRKRKMGHSRNRLLSGLLTPVRITGMKKSVVKVQTQRNVNKPPLVRKLFPETWIWDNINQEGLVEIYVNDAWCFVMFICWGFH